MRHLFVFAVIVASCTALAADSLPAAGDGTTLTRTAPGRDALSAEEAARIYFMEIAFVLEKYPAPNVQISAGEMLRDRDGLTKEQADEVIAVARRLNSVEAREASRADAAAAMQRLCEGLRVATTTEAAVTLLQRSETEAAEKNRALGNSLLSELSAATRTRLSPALEENRNSLTVVRKDWANAKPEDIEGFKLRACASIS